MIRALVFDSDAPFLAGGTSGSTLPATTRLAGLTLLQRAVWMAWKAGASSAVVALRDREALAGWDAGSSLPIPVRAVAADAPLEESDAGAGYLVLSAQLLAQPPALDVLVAGYRASGRSLRIEGGAGLASGPGLLRGEELRHNPRGLGAAEAARELLGAADRLSLEPARSYRHLTGPDSLREADRDLYRNLTSAADGYVDRVFNRRISAWFTRRIIDLPITPNQVTGFHFALGMLSAWLFWQDGYLQHVVGAVLFQLSVALDCTDGEVARLKYQFSRFGSWLDVAADNVVTVAVLAAVCKSAATHLGGPLALTLGALSAAGVVLSILVVYNLARVQSRRRPGVASSLAATNRFSDEEKRLAAGEVTWVDRVLNEVASRDFSVLVVAFALSGKLGWLAWPAAIGSHLFWVVFAVVQLSMLRTADA